MITTTASGRSRSIALLLVLLLSVPLTAQALSHTVAKDETLYSISRRYGVSVEALRAANAMTESSLLKVGQRILIPGSPQAAGKAERTYTVAKGDTLFGIARKFSTTVEALRSANGLAKDAALKAGQTLRIPGAAGDSSSSGSSAGSSGSSTGASVSIPSDPSSTSSDGHSWPIEGKRSALQGKVKGIGIAGTPGATVHSVSKGTVIHAGPFQGYGQVVFIERSDGLIYAYAGMGDLSVRLGEAVQSGAKLGELPSGGAERSLSFMVFKGGRALDPTTAPRD